MCLFTCGCLCERACDCVYFCMCACTSGSVKVCGYMWVYVGMCIIVRVYTGVWDVGVCVWMCGCGCIWDSVRGCTCSTDFVKCKDV